MRSASAAFAANLKLLIMFAFSETSFICLYNFLRHAVLCQDFIFPFSFMPEADGAKMSGFVILLLPR